MAVGPYAVLIPRKPLLGTAAALVVLIAASAVHLAVGEIFVHPLDALRALFGDGTPATCSSSNACGCRASRPASPSAPPSARPAA